MSIGPELAQPAPAAPTAPPPTPAEAQPAGPTPITLTSPGLEPAAPVSPTPPAAPPPAPVSSPVRDLLAARGIPPDSFDSDDSALDALLGAAQTYESQRGYLDIGRQAAEKWDEFQKWEQAQRAQPTQAPPLTDPQSSWKWEAPPFDPTWLQQIDESGNLRPGADPTIAGQIQRYSNWVAQRQREFWQDPRDLIRKAIQDDLAPLDPKGGALQEVVRQEIQREFAAQTTQQRNQAFVEKHKQDLFQFDQAGSQRFDPNTGQPLLTAKGRAFQQYAGEGRQDGMTEDAARKYALAQLRADTAEGKFGSPGNGSTPPPAPAPPPDHREGFLQTALRNQQTPPEHGIPSANQDGTIPRYTNEPVAGTPKTTRELINNVLRASGDIP